MVYFYLLLYSVFKCLFEFSEKCILNYVFSFIGAHIYPYPWHVSNWDDCKARDPEIQNPWWIHFENMVPMPHYTNPFEDIEICEWPENCKFHMGRSEWGSTGVYVKEITQVEEMYDDKQGVRPKWTKYNPWSAPGHAYAPCNDGCGINGLNPGGCNNQAFENLEDYCPNGMCSTLYLIDGQEA